VGVGVGVGVGGGVGVGVGVGDGVVLTGGGLVVVVDGAGVVSTGAGLGGVGSVVVVLDGGGSVVELNPTSVTSAVPLSGPSTDSCGALPLAVESFRALSIAFSPAWMQPADRITRTSPAHARRGAMIRVKRLPGDAALRRVLDASLVSPSFEEAHKDLRAFVEERAWDAFHSPKDLALSLAVEAGELLEVFQWRDLSAASITPEDRARIAEEIADVVLYAMLLADKAGVDLPSALVEKLAKNRAKYPVEKARGRSTKYDRL